MTLWWKAVRDVMVTLQPLERAVCLPQAWMEAWLVALALQHVLQWHGEAVLGLVYWSHVYTAFNHRYVLYTRIM
jgi:hypothetical protein